MTHGPSVWRMCVLYFGSSADAQDAYQDTFMKYALADGTAFENEEHRKAWLLRVAANVCKDALKAASRKNVSLEVGAIPEPEANDSASQPGSVHLEVIDAMRSLDDPPRTPLYLALIEEYPATEIAAMLDAPINTVYSWIARGKKQLREALR